MDGIFRKRVQYYFAKQKNTSVHLSAVQRRLVFAHRVSNSSTYVSTFASFKIFLILSVGYTYVNAEK